MNTVQAVVDHFVASLTSVMETEINERARAAVASAFGVPEKRGPGRPTAKAVVFAPPKALRKKPPRQLCPVPGCKNTAAPVFGMVCKDHKDVPKRLIKKYRKERIAAKAAL